MTSSLAVLIVEDSEDDALLIARQLRRSGFELVTRRVDTAESMAEALAGQTWDLILADYRMPHFSGPLALELVQKTGLDIPFILVSGTVGEETAVAMMKAGAHDFVLKQHLARLGAAVERELREADVRRKRRWAEAALAILAETGKLTIDASDVATVLDRAARLPVPQLADWCIVYGRDHGGIGDAMAFASMPGIDDAALADLARGYPPALDTPNAMFEQALRTRTPTLVGVVDSCALAALAHDERLRRLLQTLQLRSLMVIPLVARERVIGALVLAARRAGRYGAADVGLANEIGRRFALVIENVRLSRAREEFISTAIHEIKTPISVIKTAVQLAQRLPPSQCQERLPELLVRLDRQCSRLTRLVAEVLEISRFDLERVTLSVQRTDLAELVTRIVDEMRTTSAQHQLVVLRNDPVTIDVDPDRIEQVLTNLVANAIKYSFGGTVEIESRRTPDSVIVSVRDHGIGIPKDKQARIFERFYRAHAGTPYEHTSSLGVGLYLSREFITRHGGKMWFESEEGSGSTFVFALPIARKDGR